MEKSNKEKKQTTPSLYSSNGLHAGDRKQKPNLDKVRELSKSWNNDDWEDYLSGLEVDQKEEYLSDASMTEDVHSANYADSIYSSNIDELLASKPGAKIAIKKILSEQLSPAEQKIIWKIYWEGMSQRQAATALNLSRRTVRTFLERAHEKIAGGLHKKSRPKSNKNKQLSDENDENFVAHL